MKGSVEDSDVWNGWKCLLRLADSEQGTRVVDRGKGNDRFDRPQYIVVNPYGFSEMFTAVHDSMADGIRGEAFEIGTRAFPGFCRIVDFFDGACGQLDF